MSDEKTCGMYCTVYVLAAASFSGGHFGGTAVGPGARSDVKTAMDLQKAMACVCAH